MTLPMPERQEVLYLGISGVLHPSELTYELLCRRSPWSDGHFPYESVPVLVDALAGWPDVRIVLTSTVPWKHGLAFAKERLGAQLSARVDGFTFEDLTTRACRAVKRRDGSTYLARFSEEDYWRMRKADIVSADAVWRKPTGWAVMDDEDILWPHDVRRDRLVLTDGSVGLRDLPTVDRMLTVFGENFRAAHAKS